MDKMEKLTPWQENIINEYCCDGMKKLKRICHPIILRKNVPMLDWDDLYSEAMEILLDSVQRFQSEKECSFNTFLTGNIQRRFQSWIRDNCRGKRCNVERDKDGKIVKDENGNNIPIPNQSLDEETEDNVKIAEKITSDVDIFEKVICEEIKGTKIEMYFARLSSVQQDVVKLLARGYVASEISELLNITKKQYRECILAIQAYENIRYLL